MSSALCNVVCTANNAVWTVYFAKYCSVECAQYTVHSVQWAVGGIVQVALHSGVECTVYSVHCSAQKIALLSEHYSVLSARCQ